MVTFGSRRRDQRGRRTASAEDPLVRQYRFLLRQASPDAVEVAHAHALPRLTGAQRQDVLSAVQAGLVAGMRLHPDDTAQIAHLVVLGERRTPNAFLTQCEPTTLLALSQAVTRDDACFGLFGRYADWDGSDPEPEDQSAWADAGFNPDSGRWNIARDAHPQEDGIMYPGGIAGGGGDGGG